MRKIFYAALLLIMLGCLACAAPQPNPREFAGNWVVDMAASDLVNPTLKNRENMRELMAELLMVIDMDKHEMLLRHAQFGGEKILPFVIREQAAGVLVLNVDSTDKIRLELKGGELTFKVVDAPDERDTFVFVRQAP